MNTEDKMKRLEKVLARIDLKANNEGAFNELFVIIKKEYRLETFVNGHYCLNLRITINKRAKLYEDSRDKKLEEGTLSEYQDFISHFRKDVSIELDRLRNLLN